MNYDGHTRTCGLIGNPVEHTLSPLIHNHIAEVRKENMVYVPFHVEHGKLEDAVKGAYALNLLGVNVTIPYKSDVLAYLSEIDSLAGKIGAVNTLVRTGEGYKGYNTDMPGLYRAMLSDGVKLQGRKVLVLGAGGVARAVAIMLLEKGAGSVIILNRTIHKAETIAEEVNAYAGYEFAKALEIASYPMLEKEKYLVIQATSVGMHPDIDRAVIEDADFYKLVEVGYDLVYNPANTKFMQLVKEAGGRAYNGAKMLLYQGIIAYELWNQTEISDDLAQDVYKEMLKVMGGIGKKKSNIVLIGFMGSGKSTTGIKLSYRLRRGVEDTDKLIERKEGRSIVDIFATNGEAYFRELETRMLMYMYETRTNQIISVGGGTPVKEENRDWLKKLGTVVYLRIQPETVYKRLKNDKTRPLLQGEDPQGRICALLKTRKDAYESCADLIIDVDDKNMDQVLDIIEKYLQKGENAG